MDDKLEPNPTVTASERLAAELMDIVEMIAGRIPGLEGPHPATAPHVRGGRTVPEAAVISMIAAVESEPRLQQLGTFDVDAAREMLQFNGAFRHLIDRLNALVASVSFTMESRKARIAFDLLRTYAIMKNLARHPDSASMLAHIENVRRDLGRRNPGRASAAAPPNEPAA